MAITSRDGLIAAQSAAQRLRLFKTASRTSVANIPFSVFDIAGEPGAGTLAGTSTTAGVVPTDATAGCPIINAFSGANYGAISRVEFSNIVSGRLGLYDMLWKGGAYPFNANVTLASQPSYATRCQFQGSGTPDYKGTEIWLETVTAFTGNQSIAVTYTNESGTTGRSTGTIATGVAPTLGRMLKLNLQAGDTGVSKIESVVSTVATVGTFNVLVLRKLWEGRTRIANDQAIHGPDLTGLIEVFTDSALFVVVTADSTATQTPELMIDVVNG
jgi:hypothetical protein